MANRPVFLFILIYFFLPLSTFADTVDLKSGRSVEGKVVENTDKYVKIEAYGVVLTYYKDEVKNINQNRSHDSSQAQPQVSISGKTRDFWVAYFKANPLPQPAFQLQNPGASIFLDYAQYGEFQNAGEAGFQYVVNDKEGLKEALGEGIYPNDDIYKDPDFQRLNAQGSLKGSRWDILSSKEFQRAFFIWADAGEDPGVKLFFTAKALENAGLIEQAVKAYYATAVFNPDSTGFTKEHFPWPIAPAAISAVKRLCRDYPDLNCELQGASYSVRKADGNDVIIFNPGKIIHKTLEERIKDIPDLAFLPVVQKRGEGKVKIVEYANRHWQMFVDDKPYYVKGITYGPTEIGIGPHSDPHFGDRWMFTDKNKNGLIDAPYEAWIDDGRKPVGDFQLLKEMGINTIRLYVPNSSKTTYDPAMINKPLLRDMYKTFGIRAIMGDFLGAYTIGSGASWDEGTDYTDPQQREKMKAVVRAKVMDLKDEPFVLMWLLGNENNMSGSYKGVNATRTNASSQPQAYAEFLNEVAAMIHEIDKNHPVAVGNVELDLSDYYNKYAQALDVIGVNSYRGAEGFGALFIDAQNKFDRPVLIMEYGCDAYADGKEPGEDRQLNYLKGNFRDLIYNKPGGPGVGNAVGGLIFEYLDEWWKTPGNPEDEHAVLRDGLKLSDVREEWLGIAGQGDGKNSPFERHLRKAYYYFKDNLDKVPDK